MLLANFEVKRKEINVQVDFSIENGKKLALFGPSGAGKTTILEAIAGLVKIDTGIIKIDNKVATMNIEEKKSHRKFNLPPHLRNVGLLRQDPGLFPHMSVRDNLVYAQNIAFRKNNYRQESKITQITKELDIVSLLEKKPSALSGGQRHRVALGRLLTTDPSCMLLDEPFEALDWTSRRNLSNLVQDEIAKRNIPAILVTHDFVEAQFFGDTLAVIDKGYLLQQGEPNEIFTKPISTTVAKLIGYRSFLPLTIPKTFLKQNMILGIHPEKVIGQQLSTIDTPPKLNLEQSHKLSGPTISGLVTKRIPRLAGFEVTIAPSLYGKGQDKEVENIICHLPAWRAPQIGDPINISVIDPPIFDEKGNFISTWENLFPSGYK